MRLIYSLLVVFSLSSCARKGMVTGGLIDTIPPILKFSEPVNSSVEFKAKEIKLFFDEYVKLKDVNKQLIISPPLPKLPEILPPYASKTLTIKLKDTLFPNTTYSFNFGESIQDNNEGNSLSQFTYLFSTGSYIDSLEVRGSIKDAFDIKTDNFVSVMLFEYNEKYTDSMVYKQKPLYVTNTLDSATQFKLKNLKEGTYKLIALKDKNNNYNFDPKLEKIGFIEKPITIPTEERFNIKLFQEKLQFKSTRAIQASQEKLWVAHEGEAKDVSIKVLQNELEIPVTLSRESNKDSIQIWLPRGTTDSLKVWVQYRDKENTYKLKHRKMNSDTLSVVPVITGTLHFRDSFKLRSSIPLETVNNNKIRLIKSDSSRVEFSTSYNDWDQELTFFFDKEPSERYVLTLPKESLFDLYGHSNDSLSFTFSTRKLSDYGNLTLQLSGVASYPIIVDLTDNKGKMRATQYVEQEGPVLFELLQPALFTVRIIYDSNKNGIWDSGNFLEKKQPEEVIYLQKPIDVRANWDVNETIIIQSGSK